MGKKNQYIDNKELFQAMGEWKDKIKEAESIGEPRPPVTEYIGKCFLDIAEHLSFKPNFMNYPFKDEMIGDGIENCLMYAHNFDPEKSKNPFSYFTQIVYYAFLRRIEREKKQNYIKFKTIQMEDSEGSLRKYYSENYFEDKSLEQHFNLTDSDIERFTPKKKKKKKDADENSTTK